jgi:anaerobic magnesium-protoporphyrin IX monomethyl ester cyclase
MIVLVHAAITQCGFNSFAGADPTESSWISHGLCSLSACLKQKGHEVKLVDLRRLRGWDDFREKIEELKPEFVGISMMSVEYNPVMECFKIVKEVDKNIITIVGGPHPSIMPEELIDKTDIDYIMKGEGEISLPILIQEIKDGKKPERVIQGIMPVLDDLPFVDRDLYEGEEMPMTDFFPSPFVTIIAGRGCIYSCKFCQPAERKIFGHKVRRRSVKSIIEELKVLRDRYYFQSLMLHDDCLTEDRAWIEEFCEAYTANGFNQPFICQSRADIICKNEDMIVKMRTAGLYMFLIGFESGNQRILNFISKGTTVEQNYKAAEICHKYNIKIFANYMLGIPTETKEEAMDTIRMIETIKPEHPSPAFFTPHPGSNLFDYCVKNDLSLIKDHDLYRRNPDCAKIKGVDYDFLKSLIS